MEHSDCSMAQWQGLQAKGQLALGQKAGCEFHVVDIQTVHGGIQMSTTHCCLKTYYVHDRLGEIRPIVGNLSVRHTLSQDWNMIYYQSRD